MSTGSLALVDWVVVAAYFGAMIWLGARTRKRQRTSEEYFLGRRRIPGWAVAVSMFATIISSWAFIALPSKAFQGDQTFLMAVSMVPLTAWITARWVVPLFRERVKLSAYEYLDNRFGLGARLYGNLTFTIVHFGKMAAILYLLCLAISSMTGWNIFLLIGIIGVFSVIFSFIGGIEGVIWTEVTEGALLLLAGFIALAFILFGSSAGPAAIVETAYAAGKLKLVSTTFSWERIGTIVLIFFSANYYLQKYITDQTIVQRMLLAPSTEQAGKAVWKSSLLVLGVWILFMAVGALLWAFYQVQPGLLPDAVRAAPDRVFPHFIGHALPVGLSGLVLAGLIAGTMSTLSADLNSLGSVFLDDYYRKFSRGRSETRELWISRGFVLVSGGLCVVLAMAFTRIQSMADATVEFVSLVGGGVLGMFLLGLLTRRASKQGLYVGIALGITFSLWAHFCGPGKTAWPALPRFPLHTLWIGVIANLLVFGAGYLASLAFRAPSVSRPDNSPSYEQQRSTVS